MRFIRIIPLVVLATVLGPLSAQAGVRVNFVAPQNFQDVEGIGPKVAMSELRRHFELLGTRYLAAGQDLSIEVVDIDLAGKRRPWRGGFNETRTVTDFTPPRIEFRYVLRQGDRVARQGHEHLTDMNFQMRTEASRSGEPLAYEKAMLTDWFSSQRDFGRRGRS